MRASWTDRLSVREFFRDERGNASVEFVLWIPGFALLLIVTTDASVLYLTHTEMWNVARDTARKVAIGEITDAEAVTEARNNLPARPYVISASSSAELEVFVRIQITVSDAAVFGKYMGSILDLPMVARVSLRREPT